MEQHTDGQYDDDLTVGVDDYESDSIETDFVDLFEFSGGDESPISRLKTIMLELDWEITDEVLIQFNEELIDLKDIWSDDPVKLVYVQALEKISKYIYQEKSDAHPSSIKLLLAYYYNLEKIEIDTDLGEDEKQALLKADLQKFEKFKNQIAPATAAAPPVPEPVEALSTPMGMAEEGTPDPVLFNLKACILGMDWEITERELNDLSTEVKRLQGEFSTSKARMLFLQGIDSLGGYIKLKKSDSHADAFKLLYSFYEGLERIVINDLSIEQEKGILLPEVEKFDNFKKLIAPTITPEAIAEQNRLEQEAEFSPSAGSSVAPALAEMDDDDVAGFQADVEVADLGEDVPDDVLDQLDTFFTDDDADDEAPAAEPMAGSESVAAVSAEDALRGVDVETEADDDSDEEALPTLGEGTLAPALSDADEESGFSADLAATEVAAESDGVSPSEIEDRLSGFFGDEPEEEAAAPAAAEPVEDPLAGVDVETEADDDSGEAPLPMEDDGLVAPAFADIDEVSEFAESPGEDVEETVVDISPDDIEDRMSGLLDERRSAEAAPAAEIALEGVDVETEADDDSDEDPLPTIDDGVLAPALADTDEESEFAATALEDEGEDSPISPDEIEGRMAGFFGDEPEEAPFATEEAPAEPDPLGGVDVETEADDDSTEPPLPIEDEGVPAPALSASEEESEFAAAALDDESPEAEISPDDIENRMAGFFGEEPAEPAASDVETALAGVDVESAEGEAPSEPDTAPVLPETIDEPEAEEDAFVFEDTAEADQDVGAEEALAGVDVETEADDDSAEVALPTVDDGEIAPALAGAEIADEPGFEDDSDPETEAVPETLSTDDIEGRLSDFFGEDEPAAEEPAAEEQQAPAAEKVSLEGLAAELGDEVAPTVFDDDSPVDPLATEAGIDEPGEVDQEVELMLDEPEEEILVEPEAEIELEIDDFEETAPAEELDETMSVEPEISEESAAEVEEDGEELIAAVDSFFGDEGEAAEDFAPASVDDTDELLASVDSFFDEKSEAAEEIAPPISADTEELLESVDSFFAEETEPAAIEDEPVLDSAPDEADSVVFEPVDESEAAAIANVGDIPVAIIEEGDETAAVEKPDEPYATFDSELDEHDFFAEIDDKVEDTGEFTQELLDETEDFDTQTLTPPEDAETDVFSEQAVEETAAEQRQVEEADEETEEAFFLTSVDDLSDLRTSISSLGVEINDSIIDGVLNDVNSLRQTFMAKPIEKMLLELTSTIVQHIGQYGYESSAEAHGLLLSVFDKLEQVQDPGIDAVQRQELVLSETSKVLLWQQSMLDRQAIKKGDQLTFMDPLRSEATEPVADEPFVEVSAGADDPAEPEGELRDEEKEKELGLGEIAEALSEDLQADDGAEDDEVELDSAAAEFIKKEMSELKESLRAEIEALRDQLKDKE